MANPPVVVGRKGLAPPFTSLAVVGFVPPSAPVELDPEPVDAPLDDDPDPEPEPDELDEPDDPEDDEPPEFPPTTPSASASKRWKTRQFDTQEDILIGVQSEAI